MGEFSDIIELFINEGFTIVTIIGILLLFGTLYFWKEVKKPKSKVVNLSFGISCVLSGLISVFSYVGNHYNNQRFISYSGYILVLGLLYLPCCVAIGICSDHIEGFLPWLKIKISSEESSDQNENIEDLFTEEVELEE